MSARRRVADMPVIGPAGRAVVDRLTHHKQPPAGLRFAGRRVDVPDPMLVLALPDCRPRDMGVVLDLLRSWAAANPGLAVVLLVSGECLGTVRAGGFVADHLVGGEDAGSVARGSARDFAADDTAIMRGGAADVAGPLAAWLTRQVATRRRRAVSRAVRRSLVSAARVLDPPAGAS